MGVPRGKYLLLGVVVVVPAFVAVVRPVVLMLGPFLPLPHISLPLLLFPLVFFDAVEQAAGDEGHGHEEDYSCAYNGCQHSHTETKVLVGRFTEGIALPVGAVVHHDTCERSYQLVFGRALQGNDCAHVGAITLDDPLGAQGRQGHGCTLSLGLARVSPVVPSVRVVSPGHICYGSCCR